MNTGIPSPQQSFSSFLESVRWNSEGLVPAIAQDAFSGQVLMLAWMNDEALLATLREKRGVYWSRSRNSLWRKGETSGHIQHLVDLGLDCDGDTLLLRVLQKGAACHTGADTCFFQRAGENGWQPAQPLGGSFLDILQETIHQRRQADPGHSYVARLLHDGQDRILKKIGEEATEFVLSCKNFDRKPIVSEAADLLFHLLVALEERNLHIRDVLAELGRREGVSGLAEKASRAGRT